MFGHFRFSHMNGILWECGTAERSEASTALNARTQVRAKKKYGNLRCRNQSAAKAAYSIWAFIPIHVDLPISSFPFFLLLLSQAVTDQFFSSSGQTITSIPKPYTEVHGINHSH